MLNSALAPVRLSLQPYQSEEFDEFPRSVHVYAPDLASELQRTARDYLAYTHEVERTLILFGAGTDDDVDLIGDLAPDVA